LFWGREKSPKATPKGRSGTPHRLGRVGGNPNGKTEEGKDFSFLLFLARFAGVACLRNFAYRSFCGKIGSDYFV
jgi:hypothetical protein